MLLRSAEDGREPEPGPARVSARREERLEDVAAIGLGDAPALVLHRYLDLQPATRALQPGADLHDAAPWHGIARVDDEVDQRALELERIDADRRQCGRQLRLEP